MRKLLSTVLVVLLGVSAHVFLSSCQNVKGDSSSDKVDTQDTIIINDYNLLLVPDLSNRINPIVHPKPIHDTVLIGAILDGIDEILSVKHRKTGQRDVYKFDFINKGILNGGAISSDSLEINLRKFNGSIGDLSHYLWEDLKGDVYAFKKNVKTIYNYSLINPSGADVWNYFNEGVKNSVITVPTEIVKNDGKRIYLRKNHNVVILLTDGYIENANKTEGYGLNQALVKKIRKEFLYSKSNDLVGFINSNSDYHINKTTHHLDDINVLVLEITDRSMNKDGVATIQPTDFQIMKILWEKWLKESGCNKVEIQQAITKKDDALSSLTRFLESL